MPVRALIACVLAAILIAGIGVLVELQPPALVEEKVGVAGWPAGAPPVRIAFLSDIHVAGPDMTPRRLAAIVAQVNALSADCVLIGGDLVSDKPFATRRYGFDEAVAPLRALRPRRAAIGVAGNHDQADGGSAAMLAALRRVGVVALANGAARCGPLLVGGIDDSWTRHDDPIATAAAVDRVGRGPALLLSHSPDPFADPRTRRFAVVLAGHTHCGQIALPRYGAIMVPSRYGRRYACGRFEEGGRTLIVGAGLGTSGVPLRLFTRPEILLVEVGAAVAATPRRAPAP